MADSMTLIKAGCNKMVRLGMGTWHQHKAWDGHKFVCEDDFPEEEECLVYSFGVSEDATFEGQLIMTTYSHKGIERYSVVSLIFCYQLLILVDQRKTF